VLYANLARAATAPGQAVRADRLTNLHAVAQRTRVSPRSSPYRATCFGFHDIYPMWRVPVDLTYVVHGWYADGTGDPAAGKHRRSSGQLGWPF